MKRIAVGIIIIVLVAAGSLWRIAQTDWDHHSLLAATGKRLTDYETAKDMDARLLLRDQTAGTGYRVQSLLPAPSRFDELGYPLFLAACYTTFGYDTAVPLVPIQIVQNVLDMATFLLLIAILQLLLNRWAVSLSVGGIYLFHPAMIRFSSGLNSGSLYTFISVLFLFCAIRYIKSMKPPYPTALLNGLAMGVSSLLHPDIPGFVLLFLGVAGLHCFCTGKKVRPYLFMLLGCLLIVSSWWLKDHLAVVASGFF